MAVINNVALSGFQNYVNSLGANAAGSQRVVSEGGAPVARGGDAGAFSRFFNVTTAAKESRAINNEARTALLRAVAGEFGGFESVPENVLKAMNINKFGVVNNNGELSATSGKPLTQRRIRAVIDAVMTAKAAMDVKIQEICTSATTVGDMLRAENDPDRRREMALTALALQAHGTQIDNLALEETILISNPTLLRAAQPEGEITPDTIDRYMKSKIDSYESRSYKGCLDGHTDRFNNMLPCAVAIDIFDRMSEEGTLNGERYIFASREDVAEYNEEYTEPFDVLLGGASQHVKMMFDSGFDFSELINGHNIVRHDAIFYTPSHVARFSGDDVCDQIAADAERTSVKVDFDLGDDEKLSGEFNCKRYSDDGDRKMASKVFARNIESSVRRLLGLGPNDELSVQAKATMFVMTQAALNPVRSFFGGASEHDANHVSFSMNDDGTVIAHIRNMEGGAHRFDFKIEIDLDGMNRMTDVRLGE